MKAAIVGLALAGAVALAGAATAQPTGSDIPCTCRFKGRDIPVGQTMCLDLPSGEVLARCDRVLNNTAWKTLVRGCPEDGLS